MERNGSADQARKILFRAQQNNPSALEIYDQLFRIELINACMLRKRMEITGSAQEKDNVSIMNKSCMHLNKAALKIPNRSEVWGSIAEFNLS